ncbi:pantoate--beta-alanine ligase [Parasporobacterium paucivorans]|uniref:Pantothenate synthetase n=1 Tax=Parasporobacterium paucivorans DSM 15970 TaxID=1122934 RepID=A0A1M6AMC8_9FIRM|nr:pantoate--beta-alanine ligase [Parasporobacterium paucivorans]SHI37373.1 pantoate--beta-alanine ligase [Parasporobacterium paucivorans DSM 15970]
MEIITTISGIRGIVKEWKREGLSIGLVPTMGYLHEGHESLIERAARENDRVIVSDFVNPIQFGENEDFSSYPRDIEMDSIISGRAGADILFCPEGSEMYKGSFSTFVDLTGPSDRLCAKSRPSHFRGVCTVVSKLFLITEPGRAYFGQKDAQQLAVIKKMVRDLNFDIEIIGCPIIREEDGLAKSSRNSYLSESERRAAAILNKALDEGKSLVESGERDCVKIIETIKQKIAQEPLMRIDYVEIVSFPEIEPMAVMDGPILAAAAVYIGKTRLIDNFIME